MMNPAVHTSSIVIILFTWERHLSLTEPITAGKRWSELLSLDSAFHPLDTLWVTRLCVNAKSDQRYLADHTLINKKPYKYQKLVKICTFQCLVKRTISIVTSFSDRWSDVLLSCWADFQHVYGYFWKRSFSFSIFHYTRKHQNDGNTY